MPQDAHPMGALPVQGACFLYSIQMQTLLLEVKIFTSRSSGVDVFTALSGAVGALYGPLLVAFIFFILERYSYWVVNRQTTQQIKVNGRCDGPVMNSDIVPIQILLEALLNLATVAENHQELAPQLFCVPGSELCLLTYSKN
ncbi:hypothetical protein ABZP36_004945 [Zizania latifolia]